MLNLRTIRTALQNAEAHLRNTIEPGLKETKTEVNEAIRRLNAQIDGNPHAGPTGECRFMWSHPQGDSLFACEHPATPHDTHVSRNEEADEVSIETVPAGTRNAINRIRELVNTADSPLQGDAPDEADRYDTLAAACTELTRTAAPAPAADELPEKDDGRGFYRRAVEFNHQSGRPIDPKLEISTLRVFVDGHDLLRAGLYATQEADRNDHWALGETLTDETDAALVDRMLPQSQSEQRATLLGIAYHRLDADTARPLNVRVPRTLKVWTVTMRLNPENQKPTRLFVMATTEASARVVAIITTFDTARRTAQNEDNSGFRTERQPQPQI